MSGYSIVQGTTGFGMQQLSEYNNFENTAALEMLQLLEYNNFRNMTTSRIQQISEHYSLHNENLGMQLLEYNNYKKHILKKKKKYYCQNPTTFPSQQIFQDTIAFGIQQLSEYSNFKNIIAFIIQQL